MSDVPGPPSDLVARGRGRRFWRTILAAYELGHDDMELLAECCRQLDLLDALRQVVADEGTMVDGPAGRRTHPAVVEARQTRVELRRTMGQLALPMLDDDAGPEELPAAVADFRSHRARRAARVRWSHGGV